MKTQQTGAFLFGRKLVELLIQKSFTKLQRSLPLNFSYASEISFENLAEQFFWKTFFGLAFRFFSFARFSTKQKNSKMRAFSSASCRVGKENWQVGPCGERDTSQTCTQLEAKCLKSRQICFRLCFAQRRERFVKWVFSRNVFDLCQGAGDVL